MSEETDVQVEEALDPIEMSPEQRIEAAGQAMEDAMAEAEGESESDEPPDEPGSEPAEEDPEPEEGEAAEPAEPDEKTREEKDAARARDSEYAAVRRWAQQVDRREQSMAQREAALKERETKAAEAEAMVSLFRTNPEQAFMKLAEANNLRPDQAFDRLSHRIVNNGEPGAKEQASNLQALHNELAELRADLKKRDEVEAARAQERQQQEAFEASVSTMHGAVTGQYAKDFPTLAALSQHYGDAWKEQLRRDAHWFAQNRPNMDMYDVLAHLDSMERSSYERYSKLGESLGHQAPAPGDVAEADSGSGRPARAKAASGAKRTVTANDAAETGGTRREMTPEERLAEADRILTTPS